MPIVLIENSNVAFPPTDTQCDAVSTVTVEPTQIDGCPILTRSQAFEFPEGMSASLEVVLRDSSGKPIDLDPCNPDLSLDGASSISASTYTDTTVGSPVKVRFREVLGNSCNSPIYESTGTLHIPSRGIARVAVPSEVTTRCGVYVVNWGLYHGTSLVHIQQSYMCVVRSLFGIDSLQDKGPPRLDEIRMAMRDSSQVENTLIRRLEFDDAELSFSISRPVREWSETPPPLREGYDTHTFPYREAWLWAIQGYLLETAAHTYRRNQLAYQAGGIAVDDMNKEQQYLSASNYYLQRWRDFILMKKVEANAQLAYGVAGSVYGQMAW